MEEILLLKHGFFVCLFVFESEREKRKELEVGVEGKEENLKEASFSTQSPPRSLI